MKVNELIDKLCDLDPDLEVILSKDEEGNGFSPASDDFFIGLYFSDYGYNDGKIGYKKLTPKMIEMGYTEEDLLSEENGAVPCVVIYPT